MEENVNSDEISKDEKDELNLSLENSSDDKKVLNDDYNKENTSKSGTRKSIIIKKEIKNESLNISPNKDLVKDHNKKFSLIENNGRANEGQLVSNYRGFFNRSASVMIKQNKIIKFDNNSNSLNNIFNDDKVTETDEMNITKEFKIENTPNSSKLKINKHYEDDLSENKNINTQIEKVDKNSHKVSFSSDIESDSDDFDNLSLEETPRLEKTDSKENKNLNSMTLDKIINNANIPSSNLNLVNNNKTEQTIINNNYNINISLANSEKNEKEIFRRFSSNIKSTIRNNIEDVEPFSKNKRTSSYLQRFSDKINKNSTSNNNENSINTTPGNDEFKQRVKKSFIDKLSVDELQDYSIKEEPENEEEIKSHHSEIDDFKSLSEYDSEEENDEIVDFNNDGLDGSFLKEMLIETNRQFIKDKQSNEDKIKEASAIMTYNILYMKIKNINLYSYLKLKNFNKSKIKNNKIPLINCFKICNFKRIEILRNSLRRFRDFNILFKNEEKYKFMEKFRNLFTDLDIIKDIEKLENKDALVKSIYDKVNDYMEKNDLKQKESEKEINNKYNSQIEKTNKEENNVVKSNIFKVPQISSNIPKVPGIPQIPLNIPKIPTLNSEIPKVPGVPQLSTNIKIVPNDNIPKVPNDNIPKVPGVPQLPTNIPKVPGVPQLPTNVPKVPGVPQLPTNIPKVPNDNIPKVPGVPQLPTNIPKVPGVPQLPTNVPKVPGVPQLPTNVPKVPGVPQLPTNVPKVPGVPQLPTNIPKVPNDNIPKVPGVPQLPTNIPKVPNDNIPKIPGVPQLPTNIPKVPNDNIPKVPGVPQLPTNIPKVPQPPTNLQNLVPQLPTNVPKVPGVSQLPNNLPKVPQLPTNVPKVPGVPTLPNNLPKVPGVPTLPNNLPKVPGVPTLPNNLPKVPGVPTLPNNLPKVPGVPTLPGAPKMPGVPSLPSQTGDNITQTTPVEILPKPPKDTNPKKLFWNIIPKNKIVKTFWMNKLEAKVDYDNLCKYFCEPKIKEDIKTLAKEENTQKQGKIEVKILDDKKLMSLGILLSKVRFTNEEIQDIIENCNDNIIAIDQLEKIYMVVPNSEDIEKLQAFTGNLDQISHGERFCMCLSKIDRFMIKLETMKFKKNMDHQKEDIVNNINILKEGLISVKESRNFSAVLKLVLNIGNYLNADSAKGNATGVSIDVLGKLESLKGFGKEKLSMIEFLVMNIKSKEHSLINFYKDFPDFEKILQIDMAEIETKIKDFEKELKKLERDKENLDKDQNQEKIKIFKEYLIEVISLASQKYNEIISLQESLKNLISETITHFGEDVKNFKLIEFFKLINNFVENYKKSAVKISAEEAKQLKQQIKDDKNKNKETKTKIVKEMEKIRQTAVRKTVARKTASKKNHEDNSFSFSPSNLINNIRIPNPNKNENENKIILNYFDKPDDKDKYSKSPIFNNKDSNNTGKQIPELINDTKEIVSKIRMTKARITKFRKKIDNSDQDDEDCNEIDNDLIMINKPLKINKLYNMNNAHKNLFSQSPQQNLKEKTNLN